jgi:hypothetical protein
MHLDTTENLFSYGTLQSEAIQFTTFGRRLEGKPDRLMGYCVTMIPISDDKLLAPGSTRHRNIQSTGVASDTVEGAVFTVTKQELEQADEYEKAAGYERVLIQLESGVSAWVYLYTEQ